MPNQVKAFRRKKRHLLHRQKANAKKYMDSAKSYMDKTTTLYNTIDTKLNNKTRLFTQQEYDQLSTIEKNNGTIYFVK